MSGLPVLSISQGYVVKVSSLSTHEIKEFEYDESFIPCGKFSGLKVSLKDRFVTRSGLTSGLASGLGINLSRRSNKELGNC